MKFKAKAKAKDSDLDLLKECIIQFYDAEIMNLENQKVETLGNMYNSPRPDLINDDRMYENIIIFLESRIACRNLANKHSQKEINIIKDQLKSNET